MNGYKNEYEFIKTFNNKKLCELTIQQQCFIKDIIQDVNYEDKIICWKNNEKKKADIFIKVNNLTRGISLKTGNENSVHSEHISFFINFMKDLNIPSNIQDIYLKYHYGKIENKKLSAKELKEIMKDDLKSLNKFLNKPYNIIKAIDRYIVHGIETKYDISAIVSGIPENFTWLKKEDIYNFALTYDKEKYSAPHFGMLILQPKKRDLNNTNTNKSEINRVQVKWHNLYEEIINYYHKTYYNAI